MSTNSIVAGMSFWVLTTDSICFKRGSGTSTRPTFGSIVANG